MKTSFLGHHRRIVLLVLLALVALPPARAATPAAASAPAIHLAWDRVGSPLRMSA